MRVAQLLENIVTLGPGRRACIWMSGCKRACKGCISPDFRSPDYGLQMSVTQILNSLELENASGVTISGGEPFEQAAELRELVFELNQRGLRDILIFTGNTIEQLAADGNCDAAAVLDGISVLVAGEYREEENDGNHKLLGSLNQKMHFLREEYKGIYTEYCRHGREVQFVFASNAIAAIGIPQKETIRETIRIKDKILEETSNN